MARLHPGDPPVQGPSAGWPTLDDGSVGPRPWRPEDALPTTRAPAQPGTNLRPVVFEQRVQCAAFVAVAALLGIASIIVAVARHQHVDVAAVLATGAGGAIGVGCILPFDLSTKQKHRRPQPWPAGALPEPHRRVVARTLLTTVVVFAPLVAAVTVISGPEAMPFYALTTFAAAIGSFVAGRRLERVQRLLGVTLYREVFRLPRPTLRLQVYAFEAPSAVAPPSR